MGVHFLAIINYKIIPWLGLSSGFCYHKLATTILTKCYHKQPLWCIQINIVGTCSLCLPVSGAGCVKCFIGSGAEEESTGHVPKKRNHFKSCSTSKMINKSNSILNGAEHMKKRWAEMDKLMSQTHNARTKDVRTLILKINWKKKYWYG